MNQLQQCLLNIAKAFITICNELELKYVAFAGTVLGAVRHGGFIPWDDDVDFVMPRKDYEIFLKKAQSLLPKYYFLQTHLTDHEYYDSYCKIRDSRTTFIEAGYSQEHDINQGVFIDVFPLDSLPEDYSSRKHYNKIKSRFYRKAYLPLITNSFTTTMRGFILLFFPSKEKYYKKIESLNLKYSKKNFHECWAVTTYMGWQIFEKEWFEKVAYFGFEDIKIPVPYNYDEYLTRMYGDWRTPPPKDKRTPSHGIIVDVEKPYINYKRCYGKEYLKNKKKNIFNK